MAISQLARQRIVSAKRFIRRMRGEAQAHLIETDDGQMYVTKFSSNPQGAQRILINELVASSLLTLLGIATPKTVLVDLGEQFLRDNPEVAIRGKYETPVPAGLHFGSQVPQCAGKIPIYDILPDSIYPKIVNLNDFCGVLVADKWMANRDGRQAIFHRIALDAGAGWVAQMIDHGFCFGGKAWKFEDGDLYGFHGRLVAYGARLDVTAFEPWIERLQRLDDEVIHDACSGIPSQWMGGDGQEFSRLISRLCRRKVLVPGIIAQALVACSDWKGYPCAYRLRDTSRRIARRKH